jgi:hypothetical protein
MHMASKALFHGASVMFGAGIVAISSMVGVSGALAQSNECGCMAAAGTAGIVQSVRGNVFVSQATGSVPAQPRMQVEAGNSVIVGPQSASVVRFGTTCTLRLHANTVLDARPAGNQLCVAVNEQAPAPVRPGGPAIATTVSRNLAVPGYIAGGIGLGTVAIIAFDHDKGVSR